MSARAFSIRHLNEQLKYIEKYNIQLKKVIVFIEVFKNY